MSQLIVDLPCPGCEKSLGDAKLWMVPAYIAHHGLFCALVLVLKPLAVWGCLIFPSVEVADVYHYSGCVHHTLERTWGGENSLPTHFVEQMPGILRAQISLLSLQYHSPVGIYNMAWPVLFSASLLFPPSPALVPSFLLFPPLLPGSAPLGTPEFGFPAFLRRC